MDEKIKQVLWFCFYSRNKKTCKSFETDGEGACNGGDSGRRKVIQCERCWRVLSATNVARLRRGSRVWDPKVENGVKGQEIQ